MTATTDSIPNESGAGDLGGTLRTSERSELDFGDHDAPIGGRAIGEVTRANTARTGRNWLISARLSRRGNRSSRRNESWRGGVAAEVVRIVRCERNGANRGND